MDGEESRLDSANPGLPTDAELVYFLARVDESISDWVFCDSNYRVDWSRWKALTQRKILLLELKDFWRMLNKMVAGFFSL